MFIACLQNNIAVADVIINKLTVNVVLFFPTNYLFPTILPRREASIVRS